MTTHVLPSDTLLSSLLPSGGGSLASGDTIDFNGHTLVMDCDAVGYPFTPANQGGVRCKLELRDLSRITLNGSLPATVSPWVDPACPLPISSPGVAEGVDGYVTGFTANARVEIRFNGNFGLGGGKAYLPTSTRAGAFWALAASSDSSSTITFDRDLPLHVGDVLVNASIQTNNANNTVKVLAYDAASRTATIDKTGASKTVGNLWFMIAGGVLLYRTGGSSHTPFVSADMFVGALNLLGYASAASDSVAIGISSSVVADRVCFKAQNVNNANAPLLSGLLAKGAVLSANQVAADPLFELNNSNFSGRPVLWCGEIAAWRQQNELASFAAKGGYLRTVLSATMMEGVTAQSVATSLNTAFVRLRNCLVGGTSIADSQIGTGGTVARTARTGFPVDTDLPDAQCHAPNAAGAVTWRYEDRWVRKGETLRMRARWMPAGVGSMASVAVTGLATWWPDLWTLGADALAKAEFSAGLEQLKWHDGSLEWRNETGEDCQVRVWECVSGDTLGGYLRVWEATGGAM